MPADQPPAPPVSSNDEDDDDDEAVVVIVAVDETKEEETKEELHIDHHGVRVDAAANANDDNSPQQQQPQQQQQRLFAKEEAKEDKSSSSASSASSSSSSVYKNRLQTHTKLCAYEYKRRSAYESKLQSSTLYWRAFRTLVHDSVSETNTAHLLVRGWVHASNTYCASMTSIGLGCIDDRGVPIVDVRKKKIMLASKGIGGIGGGGGGIVYSSSSSGGTTTTTTATTATTIVTTTNIHANVVDPMSLIQQQQQQPHQRGVSSSTITDYYHTENCGLIIQEMANSAISIASKYNEFIAFVNEGVLPELSALVERMKNEIGIMEKLGDSIMNELEIAEEEVCKAWTIYYKRMTDYSTTSNNNNNNNMADNKSTSLTSSSAASSSEATATTLHKKTGSDDSSSVDLVKECADVWIEEMRYRMSVAFLSSVWEKCSSELSKLFISMKDIECNRRVQIKDLLMKMTDMQKCLLADVPSLLDPVLMGLTGWKMEKKILVDDVQCSIRERAQSLQLEEANAKKVSTTSLDFKSKYNAPELNNVDAGAGNFELSSPLVSELMSKAKVVEKRAAGGMTMIGSSWKTSLAIHTVDSFLHLFELPSTACKLHSGSAPEVAFQNLIPPVLVPSIDSMREGGVKPPSAKHWFDHLVPTESFALPNCTISLMDEKKNPNLFEIVETILNSGASKMLSKTGHRKMQIRMGTRDEARVFVAELMKH